MVDKLLWIGWLFSQFDNKYVIYFDIFSLIINFILIVFHEPYSETQDPNHVHEST